MINLNRQSLTEFQTLLDIALNAKELKSAIAQIADAHDAFLKDQENASKLKNADKIVAQAELKLLNADTKAQELIADATRTSENANLQFSNREATLKAGEQSLEIAREEFNKECKGKRNEINVELLTATKAKEAIHKEQAAQVELRATLTAEIEKYKGLNEKLSVLNTVAKVA